MREYARFDEQVWQPREISRGVAVGTAITCLLVGVGIGAGAALLLTPASGRELRSAIARGYRHTIEGISRSTHELRRRGFNLLTFNRRRADQQRSQQG